MKQSINDFISQTWRRAQVAGVELPSRQLLASQIKEKFKENITPHAVGLRENKMGLKRELTVDLPAISKAVARVTGKPVTRQKQVKKTIRKATKLEKILFIPDCHIPYHDLLAFDLMMEAAREFKPDHVIIMGDFIDMYSVSSHDKNPKRALKLEEEITATIECLKRVKALGAKNNVYVSGNHEDRLARYLMQKAPELWERVNIPSLLALEQLGFEYIPYKSHYKIGKMYVTHDTGKAGVNAHKQAVDAFHRSVSIGHTHRMGYIIQGDADGDKHVGCMFGWLGDEKQVDYMHNINITKDWAHGFGIGYLNPENGYVYIVPVPIVKYSCVVEGRHYFT